MASVVQGQGHHRHHHKCKARLSTANAGASSATVKHILHIVADDLGYNDIGYHNSQISTPHLDDLRECGVHLDHFYAYKACAPSRASLLAGRYPFQMGIYENADIDSNGLPANFTLLPELLRRAGFATHAVGKWHIGFRSESMTPTHRGFNTFFGFWHCCSDYYTHTFPESPRISSIPMLDLVRARRGGGPPRADFGCAGQYSTLLFANESVRIIRAHDTTRPLYLYLSFQAVHGPMQVPENFKRRYYHLGTAHDSASTLDGAMPRWHAGRKTLGGMVSAMDAAVGHVISAMRATKMWDRTLCLFHSDNGGALGMHDNGPFRGGKFGLWEGGIRVTAVLGGPAMHDRAGTAGRTWHGIGHVADVLPTLLSAAGAALSGGSQLPHNEDPTDPVPLDGVSLWAAINANSTSPRRKVVHQVLNQYNQRDCLGADHDSQTCGAAIRVGRWKLIVGYPGDSRTNNASGPSYDKWHTVAQYGGRRALAMPRADGCHILTGVGCPCWHGLCLFDLESDRSEQRDRSRTRPEIVRQLLRMLAAASAAATSERAALCGWRARRLDQAALRSSLVHERAYVPYANESVWVNNRNASACTEAGESQWWYDGQAAPLQPYDVQLAVKEMSARGHTSGNINDHASVTI